MFVTFKLKNALKILIIIVAVAALLIILSGKTDTVSTAVAPDSFVLVLDAGHGGRDGGAVAADGTKESDINLAIALKSEAVADFLGVNTVMTRKTDTDGAENGNYSERQNLLDRVETVNKTKNAVLISIHQNQYPSELVRGAEVMYAATAGSDELAVIMQKNLVSFLDTENRRVARPAPDYLLLTSSINCAGVLAELGFMSNPGEAAKLSGDDYQLKIAEILIASFLQFESSQTAV